MGQLFFEFEGNLEKKKANTRGEKGIIEFSGQKIGHAYFLEGDFKNDRCVFTSKFCRHNNIKILYIKSQRGNLDSVSGTRQGYCLLTSAIYFKWAPGN